MATRWHRGEVTAKLGTHCIIGVLSDIPFVLISRTIVTVAMAPSIDLILHTAAEDGPPLVPLIWLNSRSYICAFPEINVMDIEAVPARPTIDWIVP